MLSSLLRFLALALITTTLAYGFLSNQIIKRASLKSFFAIDSTIIETTTSDDDIIWKNLRKDAEIESQREPLLASFMHATILSHSSLEKSVSFHMANQLSSPAMISTQIQALFLEAFDQSPAFRYAIRKDILAVMDRDPAVKTSPDVLLYFKGFQALQTHRVSHWLWTHGRPTLALFLHSRANTVFQIDIHPGARLGTGIFIDHGTGVVIGETAVVGDNVSMLHKVTLGGSGRKHVQRHPTIGNGKDH